jgi:hypothetical protein
MRVLDPGHAYELVNLDDPRDEVPPNRLLFVKREGSGYPGNIGHHAGTNLQEVLRVLIDRVKYLEGQISDASNGMVIKNLRECILLLELRAAERHGRVLPNTRLDIENEPVCRACGHIACSQH